MKRSNSGELILTRYNLTVYVVKAGFGLDLVHVCHVVNITQDI